MPPRIDAPPSWTNGHLTTSTGILVPPSASRHISNLRSPNVPPHVSAIIRRYNWGADLWGDGLQWGYRLTKDPNTGVILLPQKGSGDDDLLNAALVDGELANIGVSPVLSDQIIGILNRQQSQARNSDITLNGRKSPVRKAKDAIALYNDSPLGYTGAVGQIVWQMRTFNRGAPHSTVPITYPVDQWEGLGLIAIPMPKPGETDETTHTFYLEVDWERHGQPVPYLPSVLDLEPTGDGEWPYWYSFFPRNDNKRCWCLLHWTQIVGLVPGHSARPGVGTSSAWACWGFLTEMALEKQRRAEKLRHEPSNQIIGVGGIDQSAEELKENVLANREAEKANGRVVDRGVTFLTSKEAINIESHSFREELADFEQIKQDWEDRIVLLFEEPLVALVTRGGIGYGVQSNEAQKGSADVGVQSILSCIGQVLGSIYPRVQVQVSRPNDATKRQQLENLDTLASAIQKLPQGTLSPAEVRALIPMTGISIPMVDADETTEQGTADESTDDNEGDGGEQESAQTDEMSRRANGLVLEAHAIRSMQSIDDALTSDDYVALRATIEAGLLAQYESAAIDAIVADVRSAGIDLGEPGANAQVAEIVARHTESAADTTDKDALALLLLALAALGRTQAEEDALEQVDRDLTPAERSELDDEDFATAEDRVNELYVEASGESNDTQPLDDPSAAQTLDVESFSVIAFMIAAAMGDPEDDNEVAGLVRSELPDAAAGRAESIAGIEAERFYALGLMRGAGMLGAATKTWLPSRARAPRDLHIRQYGQTVPFNEAFPSGEFWSQELWGCQCGVQVNYE